MDDDTLPTPLPLRRPNPAYKEKNGFNVGFAEPGDLTNEAALELALERHQRAERILEAQGRPIPSFEVMQKYVERLETPATIRETIKELQEQHLEDLSLLYDYYAAEYTQDMKDFYTSYDDTVYLDESERSIEIAASCRRLEGLHTRYQESLVTTSSLMDEYHDLRHTYLARLLEHQRRLQELEKNEATVKRRQASKFPQSVAELNSSPKEVQQRIAKFLLSSKEDQEKMLDEFTWAWRQTDVLMNEFKTNTIFAASMRSLDPNAATTDPRKRPSLA